MITLRTIALESKTLIEYARRAEAWNSTEAAPHSDRDLARYYPPHPRDTYIWSMPVHATLHAIKRARETRLDEDV
jgi:hypothetical protein